jgi:hypothetical protein
MFRRTTIRLTMSRLTMSRGERARGVAPAGLPHVDVSTDDAHSVVEGPMIPVPS